MPLTEQRCDSVGIGRAARGSVSDEKKVQRYFGQACLGRVKLTASKQERVGEECKLLLRDVMEPTWKVLFEDGEEDWFKENEIEQVFERKQNVTDHDPRWKARLALKKSMHERRLADFTKAVAEAESAGLYNVEIVHARSVMEEQGKEEARVALRNARAGLDVGVLKEAIHEAGRAGLPEEQIESTKQVLAEEVEKVAARKVVLDGLRSGTLEHLECAVARGQSAGLVGELDFGRAQSALLMQRRKASARESLAKSVLSRDVNEMKSAIAEGQMVKLPPSELEEAKHALAQEIRKIDARKGLRSAEILRQNGDVEAFRATIKEGQAAGLETSELEEPLRLLAVEDLKISARKKLKYARGDRSHGTSRERMLEITRAALEEGEAAGLTDAELQEARDLLTDAKKRAAHEQLAKAINSKNVAQLNAAIEYGEAVGLTQMSFFEARRTIDALSRQSEARERLVAAVQGRRIFELKGAIKFGESTNLENFEFEDAKVTLAEEERKQRAREQLQEAIDRCIIEELDDAILEGELAGLEVSEVQRARMVVLGERQAIARHDITEAIKRKNIEMLQATIAEGRRLQLSESDHSMWEAITLLAKEEGKRDARVALKEATKHRIIAELRKAIREFEHVVPASEEMKIAKKTLKEEVSRQQAYEGLLEANASRQIQKLRRWIGTAESAGLHLAQDARSDELPKAKEILAVEERKAAARAQLQAAERSHDIAKLRSAMQEAENAGLEAHELEKSRASLAHELPIVARAMLEKALSSRRVKDLKAAIKEGVTVGLEPSELNHARLVLAEQQLSEALQRKTAFELRRAIAEGESVGVEALTLEKARQVLEIEERKEAARFQLRQAEAGRKIEEITMAISAGRAAGLEAWELDFAHQAVEQERQAFKLKRIQAR